MAHTQTVASRIVVAGALLAGVASCWRPSESRAIADEAVGVAEGQGIEVAVNDGLAVVRGLQRDSLRLWASAPRLSLSVQRSPREGDNSLEVAIDNCMPGAEVVVEPPTALVRQLERSRSTQCHFEVSTDEPQFEVTVEPPNARDAQPFRFAVLSDVQRAIDRVQDVYRGINEQPNIDFLLGAGDLTPDGSAEQLERFQLELQSLDVPYYTTLGNHELGVEPTLFHEYFGRCNASFEYKAVRFTLLDSASASLDPIVYERLDEWLQLGAEQAHVVAMHIPPLDPVGVRNGAFASRAEAAKLLKRLADGSVDLTLYGHIHSHYKFHNAGILAHISGGGGAIPERFDRIGRHFLVVDASPETQSLSVQVVRVD